MESTCTKYQRKDPQSLRQAEEIGLIGSRRWTQVEIILLLAEYKKRECLYNMKHPNYRNKFARKQALDEIAKSICNIRPYTTGMDVKLKFNILRTQYHAELSKEKKYAESGKPHVTTLWFMDHIKFVKGHNRRLLYNNHQEKSGDAVHPEPIVQVQYDDNNSYSEDYLDENNDTYDHYDGELENDGPLDGENNQEVSYIKTEKHTEEVQEKDVYEEKDDDDDQTNSLSVISNQSTSVGQRRRGRGGMLGENQRQAVQKILNGSSAEEGEASEEDLFGQIVAKKLKKITNAKKRADTEHKIYNLLHSALMEELDD